MACWALSFLMPSTDVSHARPLRAVVSEDTIGEDYSEFLICRVRQLRTASVCVQRNAALARQTVEKFTVSGERGSFVAQASGGSFVGPARRHQIPQEERLRLRSSNIDETHMPFLAL
jgi:hypothetical protein